MHGTLLNLLLRYAEIDKIYYFMSFSFYIALLSQCKPWCTNVDDYYFM
jgi:hypothetical protein